MKLSSLNRYKNKTVLIRYIDLTGELKELEGVIEDVAEEGIVINYDKGLQQIPIKDIRNIEEKEEERKGLFGLHPIL